MSNPEGHSPDWQNSDQWDEYEWEQALKYSDHLASRYLRLLERFGDLPDAEQLIASKLGDASLLDLEEADLFGADMEEWRDDDNEEEDEDDDEAHGKPGDVLYYESHPVFERSRQLALGWCNIHASVLHPDDRPWGVKILFYFGRVLSCLALSIGDGTYDRPQASLAFAKRGLDLINTILGEIDAKLAESRRYTSTLRKIRELLLEIHDAVVSLVFELRGRLGEGDKPAPQ